MRDLLSAAANNGTGKRAALRTATFGKTGTTQDNRDAIFVGYAGGLVTAVWVGNDDNSPLPGVAGGTVPARIWRDIMVRAVEHGGAQDGNGQRPALEELNDAANAISNIALPGNVGDLNIGLNSSGVKIESRDGALSITLPASKDGPAGRTPPSPPSPEQPTAPAPGDRSPAP